MVAVVSDARDLPPGMVLLPGGQEMPLDRFWAAYGDDLRPFMEARIAVATPGLHIPADAERAMAAFVGVAVGLLVDLVLRNPRVSAPVGAVVTAYVAEDIAGWIQHHVEHGRIVRVCTLAELFPSLDAQRAELAHRGHHAPG